MDENLSGFYSLGADVNKVKGSDSSDTAEGVVSEKLPELTLEMNNEDIAKLFKKREGDWEKSKIRAEWIKKVNENERYWRGKQFNKIENSSSEDTRPLVDNQIFQAVETYLPAATRQNPEALVELRASEEKSDHNQKFADLLRERLGDWSDDVRLRLKIKKVARHWLLSLVGVGKMSWDTVNDRPNIKIVRAQKIIMDPDGITDEDGYSGEFIGERRKLTASKILKILKKQGGEEGAEKTITDLTIDNDDKSQDLGTSIQFIEWWTPEYMCWTLKDNVLLKKKNPHWNYSKESTTESSSISQTESIPDVSSEPAGESASQPASVTPDQSSQAPLATSATALEGMPPVPSLASSSAQASIPTPLSPLQSNTNNHFRTPRMPYVWLSIFNLGKTPVDETSLITQTLPQQDLINKRLKQIDKNADGMNGGVVVSEANSGLNKEEAKGVTDALRKGGTVIIPAGSPNDAIARLNNPPLPPDLYQQLNDTRNRMYDIYGIRGITPSGIKNEDTVRGKIIVKGLDTDRIGGGITEYFEQWSDEVYNWVIQLYYVYDDIFQDNPEAILPKLKVTVKEGSLLPKDATTKANQAIELCNGGKMAVIDLYKALEYPNPEEMAANLWLEVNAPELLFKDNPMVQQAIQMKQQQAQAAAQANSQGQKKGPSESINFKDMPPEGKSQMAKQAGIELTAESAAIHEAANKKPVQPTSSGGRSLLHNVPVPS